MMRRTLLNGVCALAVSLSVPAFAQSLEQRFEAPSKEARARLRWWWPGAAVTDEELRREVALIDANGFGGAEIQSFTPNFVQLTPEERAVVNDYAEPRFFEQVRVAGEAAKARGMTLDYTLGSSWPSGGGFAIPPEKALVELTMARTQVKGGQPGPVKVVIPSRTKRLGALNTLDARVKDPAVADWGERLAARAHIVAVVAVKGSAPDLAAAGPTTGLKLYPWDKVIKPGVLDIPTRLVLTDRLKDDGTLDWTPPTGDWQVFVFKQYASDVGVLGAAGRGPQLILDHMKPEAFAAHVARVGDPLGKNPVGIRSTFVDSLELMQDLPWSDAFLAEFRKRRGYDLTPYLPLILQPGWMQAWGEYYSPPYFDAVGSELGERVRTDYRRTVSDMMFAGFIEPFVAWNHRQGMKAKFQAHGGALDIIRGYGIADIPETEDLVHGGDPIVMRFARSAADLYGRPIVSAESMVWGNRPYDVTPDELRRRADLIVAGGVNSMILHGLDYRFHAEDWPGWHAFAPTPFGLGFSTMFAETNPLWPAAKPLAAYIARLQAVMQTGDPVVPVAYFYGQTGYYVGIEDQGAEKQAAEKAFLAAGYDFDRINPDSIARARVENKQLVAASGKRYPVLVLPPVDGMRPETAEAIARFAAGGLPIFFAGHVPVRDEGLADARRGDARVRRAIANALHAGAKVVLPTQLPQALRAAGIAANLRFTSADPANLVYVQRRIDDRTVTFLYNRGDQARDAGIVLPTVGGVARWNAMTGSRTPVSTRLDGTGTRVDITLAAGESALLVQDPKTPLATVAPSQAVGTADISSDGWSLQVDGHKRRESFAGDMGVVSLRDWRDVPALQNFSGTAVYRHAFTVAPAWLQQGTRITLDLGAVHDMAIVSINGRMLPPVIDAPFRLDVTDMLTPGTNEFVVRVANSPQNAMLDPKVARYKMLKPVAAGLVGPVKLEASR